MFDTECLLLLVMLASTTISAVVRYLTKKDRPLLDW